MEFLLQIEDRRDETAREPVDLPAMAKFASELRDTGRLVCAAGPLHPEGEGARVRVRGGRLLVTDGPFAESKEIVCGYFVVRVASRDEAIELAGRCPYARAGSILVREAGADPGHDGPPRTGRFVLLTREGEHPELRDGEAEYRDMMAFVEAVRAEGRYVHGAGLPRQARAARVETRAGRALVTDGPFPEAKEIVGGLLLIEARDREHAVATAALCKHCEWGSIEVREVSAGR